MLSAGYVFLAAIRINAVRIRIECLYARQDRQISTCTCNPTRSDLESLGPLTVDIRRAASRQLGERLRRVLKNRLIICFFQTIQR
jgi:hypothetical protein